MRVLPAFASNPGGRLPAYFSECFGNVVPKQCAFTPASWAAMTDHVPLRGVAPLQELHHLTTLRRPTSRIISLFNQYVGEIRAGEHRDRSRRPKLLRFARGLEPGVGNTAGCATKMLVGRACDGDYPTKAEVRVARKRLQQFSFVGIQEAWTLSMCVVHRLFGRGELSPGALQNVRPGLRSAEHISAQEHLLESAGFRDWADEALYETGRAMLAAQARALFDRTLSWNGTRCHSLYQHNS